MRRELQELGFKLEDINVVDSLNDVFTSLDPITATNIITVLYDHARFKKNFVSWARHVKSVVVSGSILAYGVVYDESFQGIKKSAVPKVKIGANTPIQCIPGFSFCIRDASSLISFPGPNILERASAQGYQVFTYMGQVLTSAKYLDPKIMSLSKVNPVDYNDMTPISKSDRDSQVLTPWPSVAAIVYTTPEQVAGLLGTLYMLDLSTQVFEKIVVVVDGGTVPVDSVGDPGFGDYVYTISTDRVMGKVYARYMASQQIPDNYLTIFLNAGQTLGFVNLERLLEVRQLKSIDMFYKDDVAVIAPVEIMKTFPLENIFDVISSEWVTELPWASELQHSNTLGYMSEETTVNYIM